MGKCYIVGVIHATSAPDGTEIKEGKVDEDIIATCLFEFNIQQIFRLSPYQALP